MVGNPEGLCNHSEHMSWHCLKINWKVSHAVLCKQNCEIQNQKYVGYRLSHELTFTLYQALLLLICRQHQRHYEFAVNSIRRYPNRKPTIQVIITFVVIIVL